MTSIRQSYLLSVLVTVTVLRLDASSQQTFRQSNHPLASLRNCLRHLEKQQADVNFRSQFSRKNSADDMCGNLLDHLLTKIPLLSDQPSEMQFGSVNVDPRLLSEAQGVIYPNLDPGLYAKFEATKMKKNTSQKLASMRNSLRDDLSHHDSLDHPDISPVREDLLPDKPPAEFSENLPVMTNSLKSRKSLLSKLVDRGHFLAKTPYLFNNIQGQVHDDNVDDYDNNDESVPVLNEQGSSRDRISLSKRAPDDWFHVVSTEVAKRRRQALSVNNALMALTDMVMEHGREKLMRNRDNLRYHMYIQG